MVPRVDSGLIVLQKFTVAKINGLQTSASRVAAVLFLSVVKMGRKALLECNERMTPAFTKVTTSG